MQRATVQCSNCRMVCDACLNFCGRCGQRLRGSNTAFRTVPLAPSALPTEIVSSKRHLPVPFLVILGICIFSVLFVIGTGTFAFMRSAPKVSTATRTVLAKHVPTVVPKPTGNVWFYSVRGQDDAVGIHIRSLPKLTNRMVYVLWLINLLRPDQFLPVGPILPIAHGDAVLQSDSLRAFNPQVQNLRRIYTQVSINIEKAGGQWQRPSGRALLQGTLDQKTLAAIGPLFTSSPYTPKQGALLSGLQFQTHELARWLANMLDGLPHNDAGNMRLDLSRFIYLLEGSHGNDVAKLNLLSQQNITGVGDGFGVLSSNEAACRKDQHQCGYLDLIEAAAQTLLTQYIVPQASVQRVLTTLATMRQLAQSIQRESVSLATFSKLDTPTLQALTMLVGQINAFLNGRDTDGDGTIDAVPGEATTAQLFGYAQQLGAIRLS